MSNAKGASRNATPQRPAHAGNPRPNRQNQRRTDPQENTIFPVVATAPKDALTISDICTVVLPLSQVDTALLRVVDEAIAQGINLEYYRRVFGIFFRTHNVPIWTLRRRSADDAKAVGLTTARYVRDNYRGDIMPVKVNGGSIHYFNVHMQCVIDGMIRGYLELPEYELALHDAINEVRLQDEQAAETRRVEEHQLALRAAQEDEARRVEEHNRSVRAALAEEQRVLATERRIVARAAMVERLTLVKQCYETHLNTGDYMHARMCDDEIQFLSYSLERNFVF